MSVEDTARKQLVRDSKREALLRLEDAARTEADFVNVVQQWDHLDKNRERKERDHETLRSEELLSWKATSDNRVVPILFDDFIFWRQMMTGNFLDIIYACPYEMHESVEDRDISSALRDLTDNHLEILWLWAVRLYHIEQIAAMRDCSERNIRKMRGLMLKKLRGKLAPHLQKRILSDDPSVTWNMRGFMCKYYEMQKADLDKRLRD